MWLVDLVKNAIDMYSSPAANGYTSQQRFGRGKIAASQVLSVLSIPVDEILVG